jgi:hypothetical protein
MEAAISMQCPIFFQAWMAQKLEIPFLTDVPHVARPVVEESKKSILLVN